MPSTQHHPIRAARVRRWASGCGLALAAALSSVSCGGSESSDAAGPPTSAELDKADITVLMMGNSHTAAHALPQQLGDMLRRHSAGKAVAVAVAPGWMFLDDRVSDAATMALLRSRSWSVVVLQAQKYSSSGLYSYSTAEAQSLVREARARAALPVLFPEWPRRGVDETQRIFDLHVGIALQTPACVAPVGQAWDLALQRHPTLVMHDADGSHSAPAGAYLAALMLFASITGASPRDAPNLDNGVDASVQQQLRAVAADTAAAVPPRLHCPAA